GFYFLGWSVARHPYVTLIGCVIVSAVLCAGCALFTVTTNPVELWSGKQSRARLEKDHFDSHFAPFYRTEQLIIRPRNQSGFWHHALYPASGDALYGPALKKEFLDEVLKLQSQIRNLSAYSSGFNEQITLDDICFKPLAPNNLDCAITSPLEYFQSDSFVLNQTLIDWEEVVADYIDHLLFCANSPTSIGGSYPNKSVSCLGSSGMPILPNVVFGGFNGTRYDQSTSVVLTFLVNNDADPNSELVRKAEVWEAEYLRVVKTWFERNKDWVSVSYQAERSVEDEINRQSEADVFTVSISYLVMFVYVSIFLASYRSCRTVFVDLRVTLGLGGVLIVVVSVVASVGVWSFAGTPATLIIIEVIPFLVLAVGVDNIFILVHDFEFDEKDADKLLRLEARRLTSAHLRVPVSDDQRSVQSDIVPTIKGLVEARIARTLGRVGPSLLLTSATESVAFFCGSLTSIPAVKVFALYAGVSIVLNFLLQIFAFVALLTLDARRHAAQRFDVFCCFGLRQSPAAHVTDFVSADSEQTTAEQQPAPEGDSLSLSSNAWDDVQLSAPAETNKLTSGMQHYPNTSYV
ncbi:hypothetical protein P879_03201, partial [Paragonimus westermani]